MPPAWTKQAVCARVTDPEIFFPERGGSSKAARAVCAQCAVRPECLMWALSNNETWGVWGGTSDVERRKLKRVMREGGHVKSSPGRGRSSVPPDW